VLVVNFPRYLEQASANAAISYLASRFGPGVTNLSQFSDLPAHSPQEVRAFLERQLTAERIADWAAGKSERISELRRIVEADGPGPPPAPADAVQALRALESIDGATLRTLSDLFVRTTDRAARTELLQALTESMEGRRDAGEILGRRAGERLQDAREAVARYQELLTVPESNETTFQRFIEQNLWLLGLDYVQMRAGQDIPRGSLDFILERFDGFHDLLELKDPQDAIVEAPDDELRPPSASKYKLSPALANALAQTHVYRHILTGSPDLLEDQFGLPQSRDPHVVIVIGRSESVPPHREAVLRELNKSLHRVEVVPYDILGRRAGAILDSVEKYLTTAPPGSQLGPRDSSR
jgi:hypothetical protein